MKQMMKKYSGLLLGMMLMGLVAQAKEQTVSFRVYGNCGMCKARIEKAAKTEGVISAKWDKESQMIQVTFEDTKTSEEKIQKQIAAVGHDTEKFQAKDKVYNALPGCCLYERKKAGEKPV